MVMVCWGLVAGAQGIPNGDFIDDIEPWTGTLRWHSGNGSADGSACLEGSDEGGTFEWLVSPPFVVTHRSFSWRADADPYDWSLADAGGTVATGDHQSDESWNRITVGVWGLCGRQIEFSATATLDDESRVEVDSFELSGDVCLAFIDGDGDGACPQGLDLDDDGWCLDIGEVGTTLVDCDDTDPEVVDCPSEGTEPGTSDPTSDPLPDPTPPVEPAPDQPWGARAGDPMTGLDPGCGCEGSPAGGSGIGIIVAGLLWRRRRA